MKVDLWQQGDMFKYLVFGSLEFFITTIALEEAFYIGHYKNETWYAEKSIYSQKVDRETEEKTVVYIGRRL